MKAKLIRFDRHENMGVNTLSSIGGIINKVQLLDIDDKFNILNSLYGLYDGYYYKANLSDFLDSIKSEHPNVHESLKSVLNEVESYPVGVTEF